VCQQPNHLLPVSSHSLSISFFLSFFSEFFVILFYFFSIFGNFLDFINLLFLFVFSVVSFDSERTQYCEDTNAQLLANWTSAGVMVSISQAPNGQGINIVIVSIDPPTNANGRLRVVVHFTSSDASWNQAQITQVASAPSFVFVIVCFFFVLLFVVCLVLCLISNLYSWLGV
jgi:hypothetical protein